jgi:malate dehydrogenase (oxaloacetate-decarboxylating)
MRAFRIVRNHEGMIAHIETGLSGLNLLRVAKLNKGCAFTTEERKIFQLDGLLPHQIESLEQQVERMYAQYKEHRTDLGKNIYLNMLHDYNETLFYKLVNQYLEEMLPIIYTPTVGLAVERFSLEHRKTHRGLYLSYPDRKQMKAILTKFLPLDTRLIVVTDGEGVLGIGDQGIGGINIANAKLMVYTLCGNVNPYQLFPIQLDVGTNNGNLLSDPMYLGWRHERITGAEYENFIDEFVTITTKRCPHVLIHWEDFGRDNARTILARYRNDICTLNGDIQTTGSVALACVIAAALASGIKLTEHRIVIFGAGTAGMGIAEQIIGALQREGLSRFAAHQRLWLIDKDGLLTENKPLSSFQKNFAVAQTRIKNWVLPNPQMIGLTDVVHHVKPTILIGCSTVYGAFTKDIILQMAANTPLPIIMPLSNPTSKSEATPEDILEWTRGKAIIATGSPFAEVNFQGRQIRIAQSNNAFAFPGIGAGTIAVKAKRISDDMLWAATHALSQCSPVHTEKTAPLLPKLSESHFISRQIALAVALQAKQEGLSGIDDNIELNRAINEISWEPRYYPYLEK